MYKIAGSQSGTKPEVSQQQSESKPADGPGTPEVPPSDPMLGPRDKGELPKERCKRQREGDATATPPPLQTSGNNPGGDGETAENSPTRKVQRAMGAESTAPVREALQNMETRQSQPCSDSSTTALREAVRSLVSRVEKEVLAACHASGHGGEVVPSVFMSFRPADWKDNETIDLLDD